MIIEVRVRGIPKGTIQKKRSRWFWYRPNGSCEKYGPKFTKTDVQDHIARICLATKQQVEFTKV